ncbi:MAG: MFS transporter [Pseudomonadota bacterium]
MSGANANMVSTGAPSSEPMLNRRAVAAAVACNVLEFFDFIAYAFYAVQIGRAYFPATESQISLLLSVAVFGVGFIARPAGGVVIGYYADRVGRKPALLLTAVLMTFATLGLALTPGYASIGVAAPVIVVICRLMQGFAFGGEIGPSTAFLLEISPSGRRASSVSLQIASQGAATALAGAIGLAVSSLLGPADMAAWGWRIPFAVGALLVPVALYLRITMPETRDATESLPIRNESAQTRGRGIYLILGVGVIAGGTVSTYVGNYMTTYSTSVLKLPVTAGLLAAVAGGLATIAGAVAGGRLADNIGRWPLMFWPRLAAAALSVPAFHLLTAQPTIATLLVVSTVLAFLTAVNGSGVLTTICELFPRGSRATALAVVYSIGVSLFGGTTQFLVTWLINYTGSPVAPAWYVVAASAVALFAAMFLPETHPSPERGSELGPHAKARTNIV